MRHTFSRRRLLKVSGAAALALAPDAAWGASDVTGRLARYMVGARNAALPAPAALACKHRILDTLGAMISGAQLEPGKAAAAYVRGLGGAAQATVMASGFRTSTVNAALANAMFAHADETDDIEPITKAHPGSSAVPAALAMAERNGASGGAFIRAVALGYDLSCRLLLALGPNLVRGAHRSAEGTASTFSALGAAAGLAPLDETKMRYAISYAGQQVSGLWSWVDDTDHIEKAFDFAGMGARNGVMAVTMAEAGLTGVPNVLDGTHNLIVALSNKPDPEAMVEGLGSRFFVTETALKSYSVGYPNQSALDALLSLRKVYGLTPENVQSILVKLPTDAIGIVSGSALPDVNCDHLVAVALVKGGVSFKDSHDEALVHDPAIVAVRARVQVVADKILDDPVAPRGAIVQVTTRDGRTVERHTRFPPGAMENPMSTEAVNAKVLDLAAPVIGSARANKLIAQINNLEQIDDVRRLRSLWA